MFLCVNGTVIKIKNQLTTEIVGILESRDSGAGRDCGGKIAEQKEIAASFLTNIAWTTFGLGVAVVILNSTLYTVDGYQCAILFDNFRVILDEAVGEGTHFLIS
ncbi:hypothetical protein VNO77_18056 [Canavalia gladiata]|uniref:Uncharacterized protein n=1 Tax=Canavalia gladiata TaxID=3824 RepID=A0AAN9LK20_CANGL